MHVKRSTRWSVDSANVSLAEPIQAVQESPAQHQELCAAKLETLHCMWCIS